MALINLRNALMAGGKKKNLWVWPTEEATPIYANPTTVVNPETWKWYQRYSASGYFRTSQTTSFAFTGSSITTQCQAGYGAAIFMPLSAGTYNMSFTTDTDSRPSYSIYLQSGTGWLRSTNTMLDTLTAGAHSFSFTLQSNSLVAFLPQPASNSGVILTTTNISLIKIS